ncbi:MAG: lactate racemase domain-containing protein [Anaerolineae bacterium]
MGCIEPHIIASFGGGYKNLVPGVADRATVAHNHGLNCTPDTFNNVGQPIERNPMRLDLEEAGRMLVPPVFIVNAVINDRREIVRMVAGDGVAAHRGGAKTSAAIFGVRVPGEADVVITNSRPMDQDLRQGVEDRFFLYFAYFALQAMRRGLLVMFAPTIPAPTKENLPFVLFRDTPAAAVAEAHKRLPGRADVLVFPYGGSTYPIL